MRRLLFVAVVTAITGALHAQAPLRFEVASVKRAVPGTPGARMGFPPGGRFVGDNVALTFVLQRVYGVRDFQIIAEPQWKAIIDDGYNSRYLIEGRGPESATQEELKEMVKTLLGERFGLRLHKETRVLPVYALLRADGGVKGAHAPDGKGGGVESVAPGWLRGTGTSIGFVAEMLSRYVDRPIVDRTNLEDVLDFNLTCTTLESASASDDPTGCHPGVLEMAKRKGYELGRKVACPSIFTAVRDQLGLRLEPQMEPVDVLVIDAVQLPTEN
jgi:uncharacterized protein (TIGR03435 family)